MTFDTDNGQQAYGLFYPPRNIRFHRARPANCRRFSCIRHGGPTAAASPTLSWGTQYWTSRGFAVLDVNYGGSTGYGREFRLRLQGNWGIVDVADCVNGARYLAESRQARRPGALGDQRRQRRRLHDTRRADLPQGIQDRRQLLRRQRSRSACQGHAQIRDRAISTA